jgi:hypothetical protein
MTDRDDPRSSPNRPNGRAAAETPSEPDAQSRRSAAAEGLSAIEDALLPTKNRESQRGRENVTPLPRPAQRTQLRSKQEPLPPQPRPKQEPGPPPRPKQELPPQPRPKQELPPPPPPRPKQELPPPPAPRQTQKPRVVQGPETVEEHVAARTARPPQAPIHRSDYRAPQAQEPGFLGAVVAIVSMVAVLVGLAVAYFLLRKH